MTIAASAEEKPVNQIGVDIGATLAKLAVRRMDGSLGFDFLPAGDLPAVEARIRESAPERVGLTGCGASSLSAKLEIPCRHSMEFEAWGRGSHSLLRAQTLAESEPYLLVSLGTGTSVLRVDGDDVARLGGTALGGGALLGLGDALTGCRDYREICLMAERGDRGRVDLRVSDLYAENEIPLPGETTAASFGNLGREGSPGKAPGPEDLAAAIMGLVGENVALVCCGIAHAAGIRRLVYGGTTLHENPALVAILRGITTITGCEPVILENGSFAGAVGALECAAES